jgi:hypothetical protein
MDQSTIFGISSLVISIMVSIITIINHKRSRCGLCGRSVDISVDIENTTPPISKT